MFLVLSYFFKSFIQINWITGTGAIEAFSLDIVPVKWTTGKTYCASSVIRKFTGALDESITGETGLIISIITTSTVSYANCYKNNELKDKKIILFSFGIDCTNMYFLKTQ